MFNFSKDIKVVLAKAAQTAGTSAITADVIDTLGYDGVAFFGSIATANAGNYAKIEQGQASDLSDAADQAGSKCVPANNGDSFLVEVVQPQERYVRVNVTRTVSTAVGDIYAVLYRAARLPVTQGSTIKAVQVQSPAEGTA